MRGMGKWVRVVFVVTVLAGVLAACGAQPPEDRSEDAEPAASSSSPTSSAGRPAGPKPLFNGSWLVEEGVWWITTAHSSFPDFEDAFRGQRNGLLGAQERGTLWFFLPALYGKYRARVELLDEAPPLGRRFKDVVEVSYRARGPLSMGSFETFGKPMPVPAGTYRVRLSATDLDRVAVETDRGEFVARGLRYKTYSGLILLQFWPGPAAADEVLREGTRFAAQANRNPGH